MVLVAIYHRDVMVLGMRSEKWREVGGCGRGVKEAWVNYSRWWRGWVGAYGFSCSIKMIF